MREHVGAKAFEVRCSARNSSEMAGITDHIVHSAERLEWLLRGDRDLLAVVR
jgi:hypothetical protein